MQGSVYLRAARWNAQLLTEIHQFPSGDHDDQIDCLSLLGRRVPQMSAPKPELKPGESFIKPSIIEDDDGQLIVARPLEELFSDREQRVLFNRARL